MFRYYRVFDMGIVGGATVCVGGSQVCGWAVIDSNFARWDGLGWVNYAIEGWPVSGRVVWLMTCQRLVCMKCYHSVSKLCSSPGVVMYEPYIFGSWLKCIDPVVDNDESRKSYCMAPGGPKPGVRIGWSWKTSVMLIGKDIQGPSSCNRWNYNL